MSRRLLSRVALSADSVAKRCSGGTALVQRETREALRKPLATVRDERDEREMRKREEVQHQRGTRRAVRMPLQTILQGNVSSTRRKEREKTNVLVQNTRDSFRCHAAVSHVPDGQSFPSECVVRREDLEGVAVGEREEATSALRDERDSAIEARKRGTARLTIIPMRYMVKVYRNRLMPESRTCATYGRAEVGKTCRMRAVSSADCTESGRTYVDEVGGRLHDWASCEARPPAASTAWPRIRHERDSARPRRPLLCVDELLDNLELDAQALGQLLLQFAFGASSRRRRCDLDDPRFDLPRFDEIVSDSDEVRLRVRLAHGGRFGLNVRIADADRCPDVRDDRLARGRTLLAAFLLRGRVSQLDGCIESASDSRYGDAS